MHDMTLQSDEIKAAAWDLLTDAALHFRFGDRDRLWTIATRRTGATARDQAIIDDIRVRTGATPARGSVT